MNGTDSTTPSAQRRGPLDLLGDSPVDFQAAPVSVLLAEAEARGLAAVPVLAPKVEASLRKLLGPIGAIRLRQYAVDIVKNMVRNDLLMILHAHGRIGEIIERVRCHGAEHLVQEVRAGRPALLTFIHAGPRTVVSAAMSRLGLRTTVLRQDAGIPHPIPFIDPWTAKPGSMEAQMFLKHAVSGFRQGVCILMGVDGKLGEGQLLHPCLGRQLPFARGVFTLQKMINAPVIPMVPRWAEDGAIDCHFGAPLCEGGPDHPLELDKVAAWAEATLLSDPGQIRILSLKEYLKAPPCQAAQGLPAVHRMPAKGYRAEE